MKYLSKCLFVSLSDVDIITENISKKLKELEKDHEEGIVFVGILKGGMKVVEKIIGDFPNSQIIPYDPHIKQPRMKDDDLEKIAGNNVVICDDSVITGATLKDTIYFVRNLSPKKIIVISLCCRKESGIIPNIYAFETEKEDIILFPWRSLPVRIFDTQGLTIRTFNDETLRKNFSMNYTVLRLLNKNENDYTLKGLALEHYSIIGLVSFWVNKDELIIGYLGRLPNEYDLKIDDINGMLYDLILRYGHFHGKRILMPATDEQRKIMESKGFICTKKYFPYDGITYHEMTLDEGHPL